MASRVQAQTNKKTGTGSKAKAKGSKGRSVAKMALGRGWRLIPKGSKDGVAASLLAVHDLGDRYLAVFKSAQ